MPSVRLAILNSRKGEEQLKSRLIQISILLLAAIPAWAQSATELEARYGAHLKAYEIRPGIMMAVVFDKSGQVSEIGIERLVFHGAAIDLDADISQHLIQDIVDEVVPKAKRGARLKTLEPVSMGGETVVSGEDYWNVSITFFGRKPPGGESKIVGIRIKWKNRK